MRERGFYGPFLGDVPEKAVSGSGNGLVYPEGQKRPERAGSRRSSRGDLHPLYEVSPDLYRIGVELWEQGYIAHTVTETLLAVFNEGVLQGRKEAIARADWAEAERKARAAYLKVTGMSEEERRLCEALNLPVGIYLLERWRGEQENKGRK
mgnify:CR=1 FL=1